MKISVEHETMPLATTGCKQDFDARCSSEKREQSSKITLGIIVIFQFAGFKVNNLISYTSHQLLTRENEIVI